ncbi:uncharacterized protein [Cicer arietinum]|uniref:Uncharacterized protein LOC101502709 isoform X3 n=1 Tax=Cicer arietinum TaxID=3827 RepID=A0A1S2XJ77_CICAR|nr:uncharacterized protein LOC101502709 isoform X3 [Cicer arietinum]
MTKRKRLNAVRKSGKSQAKKQLIDSSNGVNQNNHNINEECAQFGVDTRENLMVASLNYQNDLSQSEQQIEVGSHVESRISFGRMRNILPEDTISRRKRSNVVRKSDKSQAKEQQLIDSSNEVNQNNHSKIEEFAQFEGVDTRENLMLASLNHQNNESQSKQQIQAGSHVECPLSFGRMGKSLPKDTMGRSKRLNVVRKSGKAQAKEQLIDSSNEINQNKPNVYEKCAQFGDTRENLMLASLCRQNDESQSEQQIQMGRHVEYPISFGKSLPKDTMRRSKRLNVVQKSCTLQAKDQLIDRSNEVNQNFQFANEKCGQFGGVTRESLMAASVNHQNEESQPEQQIQVGSCDEYPISFGRMDKRLPQDTMGRHKRLNAVRKSGKAQASKKLIDSSNELNQNNHNINEKRAQSGGVSTRGNLMVASLYHQNDQSQSEQVQVGSHMESPISFARMNKSLPKDTMERQKRLNDVQKSSKSQAEKQLIDSSIEVNQNNHKINECAQFGGGDTRGNLMVASLNHQNRQSQSEQQIPMESHVESPISSGRLNKSLRKGEKRVRGYTRMSDVWNLPDGEFILVEVDPLGNPIGFEGKKLLNAMGCLVRKHQYAPINILNWKDMPEFYITNMLELIQSKFQFVPKLTEQTKQILKDNLSSKWRQFKHDLKAKGYDENKTEEEMAASIPDKRVDPSQYRALVHHWCSKKGQKISNINKRNRSKYEDLHCMGTKNLPRFIHETTKANGVQPSRAQIYIDTRTRKDGSIVTEKAAHVIGELKKHMAEATSSQTPQTIQESTNWENDVYSKVKGSERRGTVRCLGKVPRHSNASSSQSSNVENRLHKLENLLGNLVSVLQTRFSADQQINDVLQAIAQEVPDAPSTPNDSMSNDQQTASDSN